MVTYVNQNVSFWVKRQNKSNFCSQVLCRFIQMLLCLVKMPNSKQHKTSHTDVEYTNGQFWKQHPLEKPILMDKLFWWQLQKRKQTLWVALKRIRWDWAWSKYSSLSSKWAEYFDWRVPDHYIQGRFTQMTTLPGTQTYCMNELGTPLHSIDSVAGDTELTKLIPRFQHPKFLPLFQVVASICFSSRMWVNAKVRNTTCTFNSHSQHPACKTGQEEHKLLWDVCMTGFTWELRKHSVHAMGSNGLLYWQMQTGPTQFPPPSSLLM